MKRQYGTQWQRRNIIEYQSQWNKNGTKLDTWHAEQGIVTVRKCIWGWGRVDRLGTCIDMLRLAHHCALLALQHHQQCACSEQLLALLVLCVFCCCLQLPRLGPRAAAAQAAVRQMFPPGFALAERSSSSSSSSQGSFHRLFMTGPDSVAPHTDTDDVLCCVIVWLHHATSTSCQDQPLSRQLTMPLLTSSRSSSSRSSLLQQPHQQLTRQWHQRDQQQEQLPQHVLGGSRSQTSLAQKQQRDKQQDVACALPVEQCRFGLWPLLVCVEPSHETVCFMPSQFLVHGTVYPSHAAEHHQAVLLVLQGGGIEAAASAPQSPQSAALTVPTAIAGNGGAGTGAQASTAAPANSSGGASAAKLGAAATCCVEAAPVVGSDTVLHQQERGGPQWPQLQQQQQRKEGALLSSSGRWLTGTAAATAAAVRSAAVACLPLLDIASNRQQQRQRQDGEGAGTPCLSNQAAAGPCAAAAAQVPSIKRYGIALVNKRRDVACVLRQWRTAVEALQGASMSSQEKRDALRQQLTWLCPYYARDLPGIDCGNECCKELWGQLLHE